jgi:hypothetical protein
MRVVTISGEKLSNCLSRRLMRSMSSRGEGPARCGVFRELFQGYPGRKDISQLKNEQKDLEQPSQGPRELFFYF